MATHRRKLLLLLSGVLAAGCAPSNRSAAAPAPTTASEAAKQPALPADVAIRPLATGVWLHDTAKRVGSALVHANGLLVDTTDGAVAIDSGWTDEQASALMTWAKETLHHPIRHLIVTHAHEDRLGGSHAMAASGVTIHALEATRQRAVASGKEFNAVAVTSTGTLDIGDVSFEVYYPGPGHSPDNVVVWLPRSGILFGGCLIEAGGASDLDNVADSDLGRWPDAIARISGRYGRARMVIPGHGSPGGIELLAHTRDLLAAAHTGH